MKFDVVLANPPFQDTANRKKTPHKLWIDFTLAVFDRMLAGGGTLIQVSPASFSSPNSKVLQMMREHRTEMLRVGDEHHFPGIGSTFADYRIRKMPADATPTQVVTATGQFPIELSDDVLYLPNDLSEPAMSIHSKVMFADRQRLAVEWDYVTAHTSRRRDPDPTLVTERTDSHRFPVAHTNNLTWWSSIRQPWADEAKVMWSRSGYTRPVFDPGIHGGTDLIYFVRVSTEAEGRALTANLSTDLIRYILKTAKWSGFGSERVFARLPDLPRDHALSNDEMFALFGLTRREVDHVRQALAPRRSSPRAA